MRAWVIDEPGEPEGATSVVDTIAGAATVRDDLAMLSPGGMVCLSGSLAESYGTEEAGEFVSGAFDRDDVTFYASDTLTAERDGPTLQTIVDRVEAGTYRTGIAEVVSFGEVADTHRRMEANEFCGKVVVVR